MDQPPYFLDACRRKIVMAAVMQTCSYRGWSLLAAHIRTTHVHVCIVAPEPPEKVMNDLNSYASRALNRAGLDRSDRKRWARHDSTRYKWTTDEVEAAVDYIVRGQGVPLEVFEKS
jgi:REP element-mobilizing transposase RayT